MLFQSRKLVKVIASLICFLCILPAFSQEDSDWYWDKPISQIAFEGLKSIKKSELTGITNNFIGKPFTEEVYNDLLDRLYSLAYFEEVEPFAKHDQKNPGKVLLVFQVKEHPVISEIVFKGNKKIRNNELRENIIIKPGDIFIESNVLLDERSLRDLYIKKGFMNATITNSFVESEDGIKVIYFINEGASTVISEVRFEGNVVVSDKTLKGKISSKEVGFLKDGAFQKTAIEADKQAIINYYMTRGYIDARIVDVLQDSYFNAEKERTEVIITFIIQEGAQYTFNGLTITGNEIFTTEKLESFMKLKKGAVFNQAKFQEGISGITNLYYENGYMDNQFYPTVNKNPERKTIAYELAIQERSRSHIENIIIKGNTKTKDYVILRELPFESGDVFSREKIMSGLRNLYNTQFFSSVVPEPVAGSESNLVDLIITVEEQSTTSLQFGMTFSGVEKPDDLPISLFAKWQNSNLRGEGKTVSAGANIATTEQTIDFSYGQSWLFNQPIQ
ncbi:MAG: outer membrane protein assembly factor BamA, partial [Treponema sp.]|nr:outer membrane protein assembly factor BamA [Treponema sp.]